LSVLAAGGTSGEQRCRKRKHGDGGEETK